MAVWRAGRDVSVPTDTHLIWTERTFASMTSSEVEAALAALPQGAPDDPRRQALRREQWLADSGGVTSTFELWYVDNAHFRLNETLPEATWTPEIDAVVDGTEGWAYAGDGVVTAISTESPPDGRDPRIHVETIKRVRSLFLAGGMGRGSSKLELTDFSFDANTWQAAMRVPDADIRFDLTGTYETDRSAFLLERVTIHSPDYPETHGVVTTYEGHQFHEHAGRDVPRQVREIDSNERPIRELTLRSLEAFDREDFTQIAALPDPKDGDITRPDRRVKRIDDYRISAAVSQEYDEHGELTSSEVLAIPAPKHGSKWRVAGWLMAGILIATSIGLRLKRTR